MGPVLMTKPYLDARELDARELDTSVRTGAIAQMDRRCGRGNAILEGKIIITTPHGVSVRIVPVNSRNLKIGLDGDGNEIRTKSEFSFPMFPVQSSSR